ncbi:response regulator [Candidatus Pacearchaeota archaeon]|nr:response regulator [Candidatus Pacearchaeota archaeon]
MEKENKYLANERILIVDDIEEWLEITKNNAVHYGAQDIINAKNVKDGERLYCEVSPTIVFADINFDKKDLANQEGLSLIEKISESRSEDLIALVAMSSLQAIEDATKKTGADYFINKKSFMEDFDGFIETYFPNNNDRTTQENISLEA